MGKLNLNYNKTLKLTNVLTRDAGEEEMKDWSKTVEQMDNYIKSKGHQPIGPIVQSTKINVDENGQLDVNIMLLRQANNYINHVEDPYKMQNVIKVSNCMYVRYRGTEQNLKYAYDKIGLTAYEEDIKLTNYSYTVFLDKVDDDLIVDVFMEKKHE
jgi:hypothetical protein